MKAHCLFEQSGTFKNEFKKFGIEAYDYDIMNEFGQTDHEIDLFAQIGNAYEGKESIFDGIGKDDVIMAFFPCIMFSTRFELNSRGENLAMKNWTLEKRIEYSMKMQAKRVEFYETLSKMILVCLRRGLRLIIENPYHPIHHFLCANAPYKASYIDKNRSKHGDDFIKPTQFFFFNCQPRFNIVQGVEKKAVKRISDVHGIERSLINPDYARWFIKAMILEKEQAEGKSVGETLFSV